MICRQFFIQKLMQFSQGNNVIHAPASNTDGFFFKRHMSFINLDELAYLEKNEPFSTFKTMFHRIIPFKNEQNSYRETMR
jgi:hypothetical protein